MIDIEQSLPLFKGVFLRQRRGLFHLRRDWLENIESRTGELESAAGTHNSTSRSETSAARLRRAGARAAGITVSQAR